MRPSRQEYEEALSMLACPYYQHEGTCDRGCYSEPACIVNTPSEGWEAIVDAYNATAPHPKARR